MEENKREKSFNRSSVKIQNCINLSGYIGLWNYNRSYKRNVLGTLETGPFVTNRMKGRRKIRSAILEAFVREEKAISYATMERGRDFKGAVITVY